MTEPTAPDIDPNQYRTWTPAAQEKALRRVQELTAKKWRPFYCPNPQCDGQPHGEWEWNHARSDQRPPTDREWLVWLLMSGRGTGKTRTGTEFTHKVTKKLPRIALIAATATDAREVMLEGESGILTIAPPNHRPVYEPSKKRLTWPNGAIGTIFSGEEPDRLRGPEHYYAWLDEPAHWPLIQECWDNLMFGLRLGARPRILCTTTPKRRKWLKDLIGEDTTRKVSVSTYMNLENLSPVFAQRVVGRYEGTRLGRQELHGELLEDVEGALWTWEMIEEHRRPKPERFERIVVGIDPAGSHKKHSDETGLIVCGFADGETYVLHDSSGQYSPSGWANKALGLYDLYSADAYVVERNFGGDMVEEVMRLHKIDGRIIETTSSRGKQLRAEPIVGQYEQGKIHHCNSEGNLDTLETQMCLVEGTQIRTARGDVGIEAVQPGDEVLTRLGWETVEWAGQTAERADLITVTHAGGVVTCTPWHRIWTQNRGFVPARRVRPGDLLVVGASPTRRVEQWCTAVAGTRRWTAATSEEPSACFTASHGSTITAPSRPITSSTTSTTTPRTTTSPTSPAFSTLTIDANIAAMIEGGSCRGDLMNALLMPAACGASVSPVISVAGTAARHSSPRTCAHDGARGAADGSLVGTEPVFDIKVASGLHEFFANGVLVHNTEWVPSESSDSPDRVDALVFAATELTKHRQPASIASPAHLRAVS